MNSMNSSAVSWISQQEMDNTIYMDHHFMDYFDEDLSAVFGQDFQNSLYSKSSSTDIPSSSSNMNTSFYTVPPQIHMSNAIGHQAASSAPFVLNFQNQKSASDQNPRQVYPPMPSIREEEVAVPEEVIFRTSGVVSSVAGENRAQTKTTTTTKKKRIRPPSQTYDHIMAERRRREQLSQLFVALSALVPGLKKMDKSSVLEDAIKYMRLLQERVKILEEKREKQGMETVVFVKKSQVVMDDDDDDEIGSSGGGAAVFNEQPLPEMKARVSDGHILLTVLCEKKKGVLVSLLSKVESLNMIVVNVSAIPFGNVALDITIIAELEKEFNLTVKEVVAELRAALQPDAVRNGF